MATNDRTLRTSLELDVSAAEKQVVAFKAFVESQLKDVLGTGRVDRAFIASLRQQATLTGSVAREEEKLRRERERTRGVTARSDTAEQRLATERERTQAATARTALAEERVVTQRERSRRAAALAEGSELRLARTRELAERRTRELAQAQARLTASLFPTNEASQQLARTLLLQAAAADRSEDEIIELARATNAFSAEEIEAVVNTARLQRELEELAVDFARTGQGADRLETKMGELTTNMALLGQRSKSTGRSLIDFRAVLTNVGAILGGLGLVELIQQVVLLGKSAITASIDFESGFTGIAKTVEGVVDSAGELTALGERLRTQFRRLAEATPIDRDDVNLIGELAGQFGIATPNLERFTRLIGQLTATTDLENVETGAKALAQFQNILGLTQEELERTAASLVELGNNSATSEATILGFARKVAGTANAVGLASPEILGLGAAFTSAGVEIDVATTTTQRLLLALNEAVATGKNLSLFADLLGTTGESLATLFRTNPVEAFTLVLEGLADSGNNAAIILNELGLSEQRFTRSILALANSQDLLRSSVELSNQAFEENVALVNEADLRYATTESAVQKLANSWANFLTTIGDSAPIRETANALAALLNRINEASDAIREGDVRQQQLDDLLGISELRDSGADQALLSERVRLLEEINRAVGTSTRTADQGIVELALPEEEQIRRREQVIELLERASSIPDFTPPSNADDWRDLLDVVDQTGGSVDAFVAKQVLLDAGFDVTSQAVIGLVRDVQEGRVALDDLIEAINGADGALTQIDDRDFVNEGRRAIAFQGTEQLKEQLGLLEESAGVIEEETEAQLAAVAAQELLTSRRREYTAELLASIDGQNEWNRTILEQAEQSGVTGEALLDLAVSLGVIDEAQRGQLETIIEARVEYAELADTIVENGAVTEEQAARLRELDVILKEGTASLELFGEELETMTALLLDNLTAVLESKEGINEWQLALLEAAQASGANEEQLLALARSFGVLSEQEILAARNGARFRQAQEELTAQAQAGIISFREVGDALAVLAQRYGIAERAATGFGSAQRSAFTQGFAGVLEDAGRRGGTSGGGGGESGREVSETAGAFADLANAIADAAEEKERIDEVGGAAGGTGEAVDDLTLRLIANADAAGLNAQELLRMSEAAGITDESIQKAALQAGALEAALALVSDQLGSIDGEDAVRSLDAFEQSLADVIDSLSAQDLARVIDISFEGNVELDDVTEALNIIEASDVDVEVGIALAQEFSADDVQSLVDQVASGVSIDVAVRGLRSVRDADALQGLEAGLDTSTIEQQLRQATEEPKTTPVEGDTRDLEADIDDAVDQERTIPTVADEDSLSGSIDAILTGQDWEIDVTANVTNVGGVGNGEGGGSEPSSGGGATALRLGGAALAGNVYRIREGGLDELFVPGVTGAVLPNEVLRALEQSGARMASTVGGEVMDVDRLASLLGQQMFAVPTTTNSNQTVFDQSRTSTTSQIINQYFEVGRRLPETGVRELG